MELLPVAAVEESGFKAQSPERTMSSASSKRKLKKYMYKRLPHQRCDKDEARRIEAKSFLASITLDKFRSRSPNVTSEQEGMEESTSPILLRRLQNVSMHVVEEGLATSRGSQKGSQREQRLHEMAAEMFDLNYHTPHKSSFSRSHEHDLDHAMTPLAYHFISPMVVRTQSMLDSSPSVVTHMAGSDLQRRTPLTHSHSLGGGMGEVPGVVHYCGTSLRNLQTDARYVCNAAMEIFADC